jgi:superfamily II DNA or RNA helicase
MLNVLKVENVYSWLQTNNEHLRRQLYLALRVRGNNYFHSTAYKRKIWDGWVEYFNQKTGKFLTGLLPDVVAALRTWKHDFTFDDQRTRPAWIRQTIEADFLRQYAPPGEPQFDLYDYQVDYVNQCIKYGRGLVTAPTGAGKTNILISLMHCLPPGTPTLFMTKQSSLVAQNYEEMVKWGLKNVGRFYGKFKEPNVVTCCTIHKASFRGIAKLLPHFKCLIVDEVHDAMSDLPTAVYKAMKTAVYRFGFSATPFKFDGKDKEHKFKVKGHFGNIFKTLTTDDGLLKTKDLQDRGILSKSKCHFYPINHPENIMHEPYQDAVTLGIASNVFFHQTVTRLAKSLKGRTLILVERIEQGMALKQLLPDAHWISGKDKIEDRQEVFGDLKYGENVIAISMQQIIQAGINVFVHNLVNAAGGKAEHSTIQRMGRGLRCADDKEGLDYYDFLFNTNDYLLKHSLIRIDTLEKQGHEIKVHSEIDF